MRPIYLKELLPILKGKVVYGEANPLIKHVIKVPKYKLLKDHTMYFHVKNTLSLKNTKHFKQLVIITATPQLITHLGDNVTIVKVNNVKNAYWHFIDFYRNMLTIPFIAITGTCGKTTTKEMVSWIFSKNHTVYKTIKNENDPSRHLDYLLGINSKTEIVVMETAVAAPRHLRKAYRYFKPHVGILTSIGIDHLNGFPDLESYIEEKLSIFKIMDPKGTIVVNGDNEYVQQIDLENLNKKVVTFGMNAKTDFRIEHIEYDHNKMKFKLKYKNRRFEGIVPGLGKHNVYNATAAIAAAYQLGVPITDSIERLKTFPLLPKHVEVVKGLNGSTLIDDTWSSNPTSIESSLDVLKNISQGKKKIAVIGEIKFLGDKTNEVHTLVGNMLAKEEIDILITIGHDAEQISKQASKMGMGGESYHCQSPKEAYQHLLEKTDADTIVLVKTSMYQSYKDLIQRLRQK